MTKKDYELFANEINKLYIRNVLNERDIDKTTEVCINVFRKDNYNFNSEQFLEACYEGKHIRKSISGR
jgi:hypothetical protein